MCKQGGNTIVAASTDLDDFGPGSDIQIKSLPPTQTASLEKLTQSTRSQTLDTYCRDDELRRPFGSISLGAPPGMPPGLGTDMLGPSMVNERSDDDPNNPGPKPHGYHWRAGRVSPGGHQSAGPGEPEIPRARDPEIPRGRARDPVRPRSREPEIPRARDPASPGSRESEIPRARKPDIPRARDPVSPRSREPEIPRSREPASPRTRDPVRPRSREPEIP